MYMNAYVLKKREWEINYKVITIIFLKKSILS